MRRLVRWAVFIMVAGAAALLITYSYLPARESRKALETQVAALEREIEDSEKENERLERAKEELQKEDSFYLEVRARQKLNYMRSGETIYRVRSSESTGGAAGPSRLP